MPSPHRVRLRLHRQPDRRPDYVGYIRRRRRGHTGRPYLRGPMVSATGTDRQGAVAVVMNGCRVGWWPTSITGRPPSPGQTVQHPVCMTRPNVGVDRGDVIRFTIGGGAAHRWGQNLSDDAWLNGGMMTRIRTLSQMGSSERGSAGCRAGTAAVRVWSVERARQPGTYGSGTAGFPDRRSTPSARSGAPASDRRRHDNRCARRESMTVSARVGRYILVTTGEYRDGCVGGQRRHRRSRTCVHDAEVRQQLPVASVEQRVVRQG